MKATKRNHPERTPSEMATRVSDKQFPTLTKFNFNNHFPTEGLHRARARSNLPVYIHPFERVRRSRNELHNCLYDHEKRERLSKGDHSKMKVLFDNSSSEDSYWDEKRQIEFSDTSSQTSTTTFVFEVDMEEVPVRKESPTHDACNQSIFGSSSNTLDVDVQTEGLIPKFSIETIFAPENEVKPLKHMDSLIIIAKRKHSADKIRYQQPKFLKLQRKPDYTAKGKSSHKVGNCPVKSCLKMEGGRRSKGNVSMGRPGNQLVTQKGVVKGRTKK